MGPSEAEIETRLANLRRQRDALDREIADHVLYLELGRRLRGSTSSAGETAPGKPAPEVQASASEPIADRLAAVRTVPAVPASSVPERVPVAFEVDPVGARRYGRALIEAACGILLRAERPMHAGEILEALVAEGFTVPGQDPVAALNTRLWKRSGPDGPLRRLGDAVYATAIAETARG